MAYSLHRSPQCDNFYIWIPILNDMGRQFTIPNREVEEWIELPVDLVNDWNETYEVPGRFGRLLNEDGGPYAVWVELNPGTILEEHYHTENQWQVFIKGGCTMHGEKLTPITVHYADKKVSYGPIAAGEEGTTFLTLREEAPTGYHPENRNGSLQTGTKE
jgi:hypothetical protein